MVAVSLPKVITRHRDGLVHVYVVDSGAVGPLEPAAVFRMRPGDELVESVVRPDLERVVYTTPGGVVCLARTGEPLWAVDFGPRPDVSHAHRAGCALSLDGGTVWVYRPDVMAQRGTRDQWVALDADSGAVLARRELDTAGHGGVHHLHPADGSVYLTVGEGQDGAVLLRGVAGADGGPEFTTDAWPDRCLIDVAPSGEQFMTVDHDQSDVAFHRHPGGEVVLRLSARDFGCDPEDTFLEWSGGYLDAHTAVVALSGESGDEEIWFRHHPVNVRTGTVGDALTTAADDAYDLLPLGDGSWLTERPGGHPVRGLPAPQPSAVPRQAG
ncbi:hypothetical protein ACIA6E_20565 [Streptomyces sp. NPDC051815]|uniref:hypothetical protein n=1 Tax=Streptomyces sp. NPDC051815 TaxID=3365674 RepID=UPI003788FE7C